LSELSKSSGLVGGYKFTPTPPEIVYRDFLLYHLKKYGVGTALKTVLDIRSSDGNIVSILEKEGMDAYGIEAQQAAVDVAKNRNLKVYHGFFPDEIPEEIGKRRYDLILINECIYYFEDIAASLKKIKELLSENGLLFIKTHQEDRDCYCGGQSSLFSGYGDQIQSIPTIYSLKHWLKSSGFELLEILPYPFGDYYKFFINEKELSHGVSRKIKIGFNLIMPHQVANRFCHNMIEKSEDLWARRVDRVTLIAKLTN